MPRVVGLLPSDPVVDARTLSFAPRGPRLPSDEDIARAVHLVLRARLASLSGQCDLGRELLEAAAGIAPPQSLDEGRREHARACLWAAPGSAPEPPVVASRGP